jgi:hypothetical protein
LSASGIGATNVVLHQELGDLLAHRAYLLLPALPPITWLSMCKTYVQAP